MHPSLKWFVTAVVAVALSGGSSPEVPRLAVSYRFKDYGIDQGLTNLAVLNLTQDPAGYVWAGTEDGLFRYDGRRFTRFQGKEGLPSPSILGIRAAKDGWIWAVTEGGLARGRNGQFEAVHLGQGMEGEPNGCGNRWRIMDWYSGRGASSRELGPQRYREFQGFVAKGGFERIYPCAFARQGR